MTNRERADQLLAEGVAIAGEMRQALEGRRWNLAVRRAQEVVELVTKSLLNEMGVEYPREHDAAPVLTEALRRSREVDHLCSAGVTQARNSLGRVDQERDREQNAVTDRYSRDLDHTWAAGRDDPRSGG